MTRNVRIARFCSDRFTSRKHHDWIERRDYFETNTLLQYKGNKAGSGLLRRASIELDEPLSWQSSSKGQRREGWQPFSPYPQLMRPRFPDPLSLFGEISSNRSYPWLEYQSSSECVCLSVTTG